MTYRTTVRTLASAIAITAACFGAYPALAQSEVDEEPATVASNQEIIVTGTSIRGVAPIGSSVISIGADDVSQAGVTSVSQMLLQSPLLFNNGISESNRTGNGATGNTTFGSSANLHSIGTYATLTLVDGHRVVPQGQSGASIDASSIPVAMIERIEILADGSSATYGSDAVAGVVNLILRRNFDGLEATAKYGVGDHYDEYLVSLLGGKRWDSGQLTLAVEKSYRSNVNGRHRDWYGADLSAHGYPDFRTLTCTPGTYRIGGNTYALPAGGVTQATANQLVAGTSNKCDNFKSFDLLPEQKRWGAAFTFDQTFGPVHFFADGYYNHRKAYAEGQVQSASIPITSASPFFIQPPGVTATSGTVDYNFGGLLQTNDYNAYSRSHNISTGVDIELPAGFVLTGMFNYGKNYDQNLLDSGIQATAITNAVRDGLLNPFLPATGLGSLPAHGPLNNAINYQPGGSKQFVYDVKVDGSLFTLPGGDVKIAVGYQHLKLDSHMGLSGITPGNEAWRYFHRRVDSVYGEIVVPLVGPDSGIGSVDIMAQLRHDRYKEASSYGNESKVSTENPKLGITWEPIDGFSLRGSYGTSFRQPTFAQIYGNSSQLNAQVYQSSAGQVNGIAISGPNFDLEPEESTTWTVGFDLSPTAIRGLRAGVTYWNIDYRNQINGVLGNTVTLLNSSAQYDGTGVITYFPNTAALNAFLSTMTCAQPGNLNAPCTVRIVGAANPAVATVFIDGRNKNLSVTKANGIDFDISYSFDTQSAGSFSTRLAGTYYLTYDVSATAAADPIDLLGVIGNPQEFRARGSVSWNKGMFDAGAFVNYVSGYENNVVAPSQDVDSFVSVDLHLGLTLDSGLFASRSPKVRLSLDVSNVFDADPPFVALAPASNGGGGWDPQVGNPLGRVVSFGISTTF